MGIVCLLGPLRWARRLREPAELAPSQTAPQRPAVGPPDPLAHNSLLWGVEQSPWPPLTTPGAICPPPPPSFDTGKCLQILSSVLCRGGGRNHPREPGFPGCRGHTVDKGGLRAGLQLPPPLAACPLAPGWRACLPRGPPGRRVPAPAAAPPDCQLQAQQLAELGAGQIFTAPTPRGRTGYKGLGRPRPPPQGRAWPARGRRCGARGRSFCCSC